ncbi:MAG: hypothetical protein OEU91_03270 [Gammaproteobacteria bacterium]|nr:hypothetical protein [Gammaproteobacteria bacterium]
MRNAQVPAPSEKNVGYFIPAAEREKAVITPGGGGDKITYAPYKQTEAALNTILGRAFSKVYSMRSTNDTNFIAEKNISYIFTPVIETSSSSSGIFTWPATDFSLKLTCTAVDANGNKVWNKTVTGEGHAEYNEFIKDFGLSGRRAAEAAYTEMLMEIANAGVF